MAAAKQICVLGAFFLLVSPEAQCADPSETEYLAMQFASTKLRGTRTSIAIIVESGQSPISAFVVAPDAGRSFLYGPGSFCEINGAGLPASLRGLKNRPGMSLDNVSAEVSNVVAPAILAAKSGCARARRSCLASDDTQCVTFVESRVPGLHAAALDGDAQPIPIVALDPELLNEDAPEIVATLRSLPLLGDKCSSGGLNPKVAGVGMDGITLNYSSWSFVFLAESASTCVRMQNPEDALLTAKADERSRFWFRRTVDDVGERDIVAAYSSAGFRRDGWRELMRIHPVIVFAKKE